MSTSYEHAAAAPLDQEKWKALYRRIARLRHAELCIARHYPEQRMRCPVHLSTGQEGIAAGLAEALEPSDKLYASHRSHGAYIASGGDLRAFFAELLGREGGICGGRGGSMHLASPDNGFMGSVPILGDAIALATGNALAARMRGESSIVAVVFGDGATEEGIFHESLQFAALKQLPIIYVCENNGISVNTPWETRHPADFRLTEAALAHGVRAVAGNGNDPVEVLTECMRAAEIARSGQGPSFLEFFTWRWQEHCGPRDEMYPLQAGNQTFFPWKKSCPLENMRDYLENCGVERQILAEMEENERIMVEEAWQWAHEAPYASHSGVGDHVYAPQRGRI